MRLTYRQNLYAPRVCGKRNGAKLGKQAVGVRQFFQRTRSLPVLRATPAYMPSSFKELGRCPCFARATLDASRCSAYTAPRIRKGSGVRGAAANPPLTRNCDEAPKAPLSQELCAAAETRAGSSTQWFRRFQWLRGLSREKSRLPAPGRSAFSPARRGAGSFPGKGVPHVFRTVP